jgi:chromosome segregation ATPase
MKSTRIPLIILALALAGAVTAAWGAQSVMNLISSGEAVQKEVAQTKAAYDAVQNKKKDMAAQAKQFGVDQNKLAADVAQYQKDSAAVNQSAADFKNRCGADKKLNQDEYKASTADQQQINADVTRVNGEFPALKQREDSLNAKIAEYNKSAGGIDGKVNDAYKRWDEALKQEGSWLDQARSLLVSEAFKSYGQKAGCPAVGKPATTPEAADKMTNDILTCLKKVSST